MSRGIGIVLSIGSLVSIGVLAYLWIDALTSLNYAREGEAESLARIAVMKTLVPIASQTATIEEFEAAARMHFPTALITKKGNVVWIDETGVRFSKGKIIAVVELSQSAP